LPAAAEVLPVACKVNFLAPARGTRLVARGRVLRSGRTISVCSKDVVAVNDGHEMPVATMLATTSGRAVDLGAGTAGGLGPIARCLRMPDVTTA